MSMLSYRMHTRIFAGFVLMLLAIVVFTIMGKGITIWVREFAMLGC